MDDLTDDYRRASEREAGRPSAASRAAILAEARAQAAARSRPPAANASRFAWPVAASVLVAGFGLLVWREVGRSPESARELARSMGAPPDMKLDLPTPSTAAAPQPAPQPAPTTADAKPEAAAAEAQRELRDSERIVVDLTMRPPIPETVFMPPPPRIDEPAPAANAQRSREATARSAAAGVSASREPPEAVLQRRFPDAMASATPPSGVWVLEDAAGRVVRTGSLQPGEDFGAVTRELQTAFPQRRVGAFTIRPARNTQGRTVQLGVARLDCQDSQDASFCAEPSR